MEENDRAWSMKLDEAWPEDMEQRRVADLRKFLLNNPGLQWTNGDLTGGRKGRPSSESRQWANGDLSGGRKGRPLSESRPWTNGDLTGGRKGRPSSESGQETPSGKKRQKLSPSWSVETTLELLEAMKVFVRANSLSCMGVDVEKWKAVATRLSNPSRVELKEYAKSCQVRYQNLRRYTSPGDSKFRENLFDGEVHRSLNDYLRICQRNKVPCPKGSAPSS